MSVLFMAQLHLLYTWGQVSSSVTLVNIICLYNIHVLQILWVEITWQRTLQPNMHPVESWGCLVLNESCNRLEYILHPHWPKSSTRHLPTRLSFSCPLSAACYMSPSMADTLQRGKASQKLWGRQCQRSFNGNLLQTGFLVHLCAPSCLMQLCDHNVIGQ